MRQERVRLLALIAMIVVFGVVATFADEPKPKPENTLSLTVEAVKPQTFPRPVKFFIDKVVDRSGNPQPMMMLKERGGVFIDREPVAVVREALEKSLKAADLLASDKDTANFVLDVYVFHFGLGESSGFELFGKVDLNVVVKDRIAGKSETVTAMGTAIEDRAVRKKNIMKNMQADLEGAVQDALRNFLRGAKLRGVVMAAAPATPATTSPTPATAPSAEPTTAPSTAVPPAANPPAEPAQQPATPPAKPGR